MKRIFIALKVNPGETLVNLVSSIKSGLINEGIKWINLDNIHITLAFLGDTEENMINILRSKLKDKCEGSGKFELMLQGTGLFKNYHDPRVIWAGIEMSEKLTHLNAFVIDAVREAVPGIEERPFKPHLTLGRIKFINNKPALEALLKKFHETKIQRVPVNEVILYESILKPDGPLYNPLDIIKL
jgi:RNA 2',3'-cyclic 3'-phosphodiesterase